MGDYDVFAILDSEEYGQVLSRFGSEAKTASRAGEAFYLMNTARKTITPLPFLALAFGGQYNNEPPFGKELETVSVTWEDCRLEPFQPGYDKTRTPGDQQE